MAGGLVAGFWGLLAGSALVLGTVLAYFLKLPQRAIAGVMAFGSGVLLSALAFEFMEEAFARGGLGSTAIGFLAGAMVYTVANVLLARHGAKHRKRSGEVAQPAGPSQGGGMAIAVGSLLDGIPESLVIGLSLLEGGTVSLVAFVAIFLSNIPEGLSSTAGMKRAGRSSRYIFGLWIGVAVFLGLCSLVGFSVLQGFPPAVIAATTAVAAGAILAMLADTMIPEAFSEAHDFAGLITVLGFLVSYGLSKMAG